MFTYQVQSMPYDPSASMTVWLMYLVAVVVYFSPIAIAFVRNVKHRWLLYFCNLLLGFTGIAWVYCLFSAIFGDKEGATGKLPAAA
ncbi:MAG: superinfection immunity protein [Rhodopseudomonas sp.]|nr:superinfection immunity protein [Rhodopseudomonas sp.]